MTDSYLLLTPLLVLGVLALIRFIGCNWIFGLDPTIPGLPAPADIHIVTGDQSVTLSWDYNPQDAVSFTVIYGTVMGGPYPDQVTVPSGSSFQHSATVAGLANGTTYFFVVTGETGSSDSAISDSAEVSATPGVTSFIVTTVLGPQRNNFSGLVGMAIEMGPVDIVVTQLGRIVGPANVQSHVVSIIEAGPGGATIASVTIQMPAGPVDTYAYVALPQPVTLLAFRQYFIVSHEVAGGDIWHDRQNIVTTTNVAAITSAIFSDDAQPGFVVVGGANETYVPVNFRY